MKRWLARILVCLFLGAVTTVAVAWTLTFTIPLMGPVPWARMAVRAERPGWLMSTFEDSSALHIVAMAVAGDWAPGNADVHAPGWSRAAHPPTVRDVETHTLIHEQARGWPMLSLYSRKSHSGNWHTEWGWELDFAGRFAKPRTLPLAAIWPGFLIDSLFYGVIWLGLFFGFSATRAARRALRTRRGLCPMCAYDLRGHTDPHPRPLSSPQASRGGDRRERGVRCPECGWNRE